MPPPDRATAILFLFFEKVKRSDLLMIAESQIEIKLQTQPYSKAPVALPPSMIICPS